MRILLTNDDGYKAPGIQALYKALTEDHEVVLIAPDTEKSAVSHGITLNSPLRIKKVDLESSGKGYAVTGTPADCVKLGLFEIFETPPDLVISGINAGGNLGIDINYSGTASAAREGVLNGLPGMAVSLVQGKVMDYQGMAGFTLGLVSKWPDLKLSPGTFLNVNGPDIPMAQVNRVEITRQSLNNLSREFDRRIDPKNRPYFWYGGGNNGQAEPGTDIHAVLDHSISITPIRCDTTDNQALGGLDFLSQNL
ncbi:5'/3'-nucleotidase SurE [Desulfospira joergensenii]|uniref:5'/3'-nucleotidase SurE n=1 Tax=Desulfospira joergensenii TaxID=53329 RepID=UPI0003B5FF32|nr:5'/3'-nucleotidase SurE [Desulfospira joergensenii]